MSNVFLYLFVIYEQIDIVHITLIKVGFTLYGIPYDNLLMLWRRIKLCTLVNAFVPQ